MTLHHSGKKEKESRGIIKENAPDIINYMMYMKKLAVTRKSEFSFYILIPFGMFL